MARRDIGNREEYDRSHEGYAQRRHQREFARPLSMMTSALDGLARGTIEAFDLLDHGWVHEGLTHRRDEALRFDLQLSAREAQSGGLFRFAVPVRRRCDACGLLGRLDCPTCGGDGYVVDDREIEIAVPAGVRHGASCAMPLGVEGRNVEVTVHIR